MLDLKLSDMLVKALRGTRGSITQTDGTHSNALLIAGSPDV